MTKQEKEEFDKKVAAYYKWRESLPYDADMLDELDTGEITMDEFVEISNRQAKSKETVNNKK